MLATITGYKIALFLHVLAVVLAFGPTFGYAIFFSVAPSRNAPRSVPAVLRAAQMIDRFLVTPAMVVLLLAGIYLLADGRLGRWRVFVAQSASSRSSSLFGWSHGFFLPRRPQARSSSPNATSRAGGDRQLTSSRDLSEEHQRAAASSPG